MSLKRQLSSLDRSVTPPTSKKKQHIESSVETGQHDQPRWTADLSPPALGKEHIKIVSWNVNGVRPFLQRTLSSFFQPSPTRSRTRKPSRTPSPPASPSHPNTNPNPAASGPTASISPLSLRDALRHHNWPHFLCLQEVKIAPDDLASQRGLKNAANAATDNTTSKSNAKPITDFFSATTSKVGHYEASQSRGNDDDAGNSVTDPTYELIFSLPHGKHIGLGGRVHGVATLIREDILPHLTITTHKPDWDLEGRILAHQIGNGLVVINGYWPNGTTHPYRSPLTGAQDGRTRHDVKLHYHRMILDMVRDYEKKGKAVILIGDMNVAPARIDGYPNLRVSPVQHVLNRKDFNDKFLGPDGMNGVDLIRHIHGDMKKYTWHSTNAPHGTVCDRVDLIIASRCLVPANEKFVIDANICDDALSKGHSDHCPLWVVVDLAQVPQAGEG